jgi:hypothetical protein
MIDNPQSKEHVLVTQYKSALTELAQTVTPKPLTVASFNPDVLSQVLIDVGINIDELIHNDLVRETIFLRSDPAISWLTTPNFNSGKGMILSIAFNGVNQAKNYYDWVLNYCRGSEPVANSMIDHTINLMTALAKISPADQLVKETNWRVYKTHNFFCVLSEATKQQFNIPDSDSTWYYTFRSIHPIPVLGPLDVWNHISAPVEPASDRTDLS